MVSYISPSCRSKIPMDMDGLSHDLWKKSPIPDLQFSTNLGKFETGDQMHPILAMINWLILAKHPIWSIQDWPTCSPILPGFHWNFANVGCFDYGNSLPSWRNLVIWHRFFDFSAPWPSKIFGPLKSNQVASSPFVAGSWTWWTISHRIHGTGIFTYIYHKHQPHVGKYTIHGSYGYENQSGEKNKNKNSARALPRTYFFPGAFWEDPLTKQHVGVRMRSL